MLKAVHLGPIALRLHSLQTIRMAASSTDPEILHEMSQHLGILTLSRPKALNALTTGMVQAMYAVLKEWDTTSDVSAVLIRGAGDRAFCAGGDVKAVMQMGREGRTQEAMRFFRSEYHLNYLISCLTKPYVAFLDGITMGGGAGVSVHGSYRVATERTLFAMPECGIGLIPDVGGSFFLPRLPGAVGLYLGLTGARLKGVDVLQAGLATHYIPSQLLPELQQRLISLGAAANTQNSVGLLLNELQARAPLPEGELAAQRQAIDAIFGGKSSVEEIYAACKADDAEFARQAAALMAKGSPTSLRIVMEQLRRGSTMPLDECLRMEHRIVHHLVAKQRSDFYSGVEAALITRSGAPTWHPPRLKDVTHAEVLQLFERLQPHEELQLEAKTMPKL